MESLNGIDEALRDEGRVAVAAPPAAQVSPTSRAVSRRKSQSDRAASDLASKAFLKFERLRELGKAPSIDEFVRRYPKFAGHLRAQLHFDEIARGIERDYGFFPVRAYVAPSERARRRLAKWGIRAMAFVPPWVQKSWLKGLGLAPRGRRPEGER